MESKERIAYLKGLLDGLRPQDETQVKVYAAIVDALEALADETEMHADELHEQAEMVEELNEFPFRIMRDHGIRYFDSIDIRSSKISLRTFVQAEKYR